MQIITLAISASVVFLVIVVAIAKSRFGARGVALFSAVATFGSCIFSPLVSMQAALTFVLALVVAIFRLKSTAMVRGAIAVMGVSLSFAGFTGYARYQTLHALREEFPLESVADRLTYETTRHGHPVATASAVPLPLSNPVELRLSEFQKRYSTNSRTYLLESLHDRSRDEFVAAFGFGNIRMRRVTKERIDLPATAPIPVPSKPQPPSGSDETPVTTADSELADRPRPQELDLLSLHSSGSEDFLAPERMGYVRDRDHVAGFQAHRFAKMPAFDSPHVDPSVEWAVVRLELVSLLKHDVPVAYVSDHLPQLDELGSVPTRPLDGFERQALDRLRTDEDLVIDETPTQIRLLGSLRAGNDCLKCHSVRRGELLGAFSYELAPAHPIPAKDRATIRPEPQAQLWKREASFR